MIKNKRKTGEKLKEKKKDMITVVIKKYNVKKI